VNDFLCITTQGDGSCWTDGGSVAIGDGRWFCTEECHDWYSQTYGICPCTPGGRFHGED
jgi:hypothetical protein